MDHPNALDARDFSFQQILHPDASGPLINSAKTKLTFNPVNRNSSNLTLVSWNANGIRTRVEEFRNLSLNGIQTSSIYKRPTSSPVITLPSPTTISTEPAAPAEPGLLRPRRRRPERKTCFLESIAQQNVAGHTIRRFCDSTGYSLNAPLEPTHFHKNLRNTVIDLAICKGMTITDVTSIPELSRDHNPVLFEVCLDNFTAPALSTYAFPNWKKFQDILTNSLPVGPMGLHYSTEDKVNLFADSLESSFQENSEPYDDDFIDQVEENRKLYGPQCQTPHRSTNLT
ncbi:hypothetical protein TNCV_2421521 [Trichonephila clavipes]|nr:hypothetical protein TNCV_2421521 [Trichonephila clavipes]